jgi:pimeloyl-ACP methyl ester carboxylesterase
LLTVFAVIVRPVTVEPAGATDKPAIRTFDSWAVKITYLVQGKGEPVVLIHGWLSSAGINWALPGTIALLARNHRVIALDRRGHGLSDKPTKEAAYGPELVEDVVRLLDHLKVRKAHVVGYSMGGIIALNFIVKHPDRVRSGMLGGMGWLQAGSVAQWGFAPIGKDYPNAKALTLCGRSLGRRQYGHGDREADAGRAVRNGGRHREPRTARAHGGGTAGVQWTLCAAARPCKGLLARP